MKRPILIIVSVVVAFVLVGSLGLNFFSLSVGRTFNSVSSGLPGYGGGGAPDYALFEEASAPATTPINAPLQLEIDQLAVQTQERMVIQNADLAIVVADPKTRLSEIAAIAKEMGGFVVSSNLYTTSYGPNSVEAPEATITIRVPQERLDDALNAIKEGAVKVDYENRTSEDVTKAYVDLQSQLKAKQAAEKKLLEFLEKAEDTESALAVYTQLQVIQSEIEVLKGQIKYYDESVSTSAVSVRLIAEETVQPVEIGGWKLEGTLNDAVQKLINFTQGFVKFLINLVVFFLPALLMIAVTFYLLFLGGRGLFRRFRKSKVTAEVKDEGKK
ncbi:MAG: DUF4349 domain-containing protein [Anaerolineales bacterium]|nr:DUF4349 domain-containing protein [Anaerolineales bacterium]